MSAVKRRVYPESFKREAVDWVATSGLSTGRWRPSWACTSRCCDDG
jgi:hypothetical protein